MKIKQLALCFAITSCTHFFVMAQQTDMIAYDKSKLSMDSILKQGPEYKIINAMAGDWNVAQTIFKMGGKEILSKDTFEVHREMAGSFLQEIMQPRTGAHNKFRRISYLNYNRTNRRWEYVVLDTRYPIIMPETSSSPDYKSDSVTLRLDAFVTPPFWGESYAGLMARQRRVLKFNNDKLINEQFWTLPSMDEFLAIRYEYFKK